MKFLSSLFVVLSLSNHLMAAPLRDHNAGGVDTVMTNGQKTALHYVRQAKNLGIAIPIIVVPNWQILLSKANQTSGTTNAAPNSQSDSEDSDSEEVSHMRSALWRSEIILTAIEAALLQSQPFAAKNLMLAAPSMALAFNESLLSSIFSEQFPPEAIDVVQTLLMKSASALCLIGGALSLKDWYQERHKPCPNDASRLGLTTRQAKVLHGVRQAKNLSFLVSGMAWLGNFNKDAQAVSTALAATLTGVEVLLAQPMSVKQCLKSAPGILLPFSDEFMKENLFVSENMGNLLMMGTILSFAMRTFLSHKEMYQGRKKFETTAVQEKPILSAKLIQNIALSVLGLSPSIKVMRLQPIAASNIMLGAPGMALAFNESFLSSIFSEQFPPGAIDVVQTLLMKCASVMYLIGGVLSLKDWCQGRNKPHADDKPKPVLTTRQAKALEWVRQVKNLTFFVSSVLWLGNFKKSVAKFGGHLGLTLLVFEVLLARPISIKDVGHFFPKILRVMCKLVKKESPFASEITYKTLKNAANWSFYVSIMWQLKDWYQGCHNPNQQRQNLLNSSM